MPQPRERGSTGGPATRPVRLCSHHVLLLTERRSTFHSSSCMEEGGHTSANFPCYDTDMAQNPRQPATQNGHGSDTRHESGGSMGSIPLKVSTGVAKGNQAAFSGTHPSVH